MTIAASTAASAPAPARRPRLPLAWLGVVPFFAYTTVFLLWPAFAVLRGALEDGAGHFTTANVSTVLQKQYLHAFESSFRISGYSALGGAVLGSIMAYACLHPRSPRLLRPVILAFSGVAANFAGVPLAFAFIATLGTTGLVTRLLADLSFDLYGHGFSLGSELGISLVYLFFQIPLMVLVIAPAIDGLRPEWREAAANLGASSGQYWRLVGLPVLAPAVLGAAVLLFGNAFAAYATAYQVTSGANLVPLRIGDFVSGNVLDDPGLGYALALGMVVVVAVVMALYTLLMRRATRWTR